MRASIGTVLVAVVLLVTPALARSDDEFEGIGAEATPVEPPSVEPMDSPPAPGDFAGNVPAGQWVYTNQYGWIWMPYGDAYASVPADAGVPNMYVYYPSVGWCWLTAPWLWGWGPMPYFGSFGYAHYGWYGRGYGGRWYGYAGRYAGWYGGGRYWHGGAWHGAFAAPARGGYGPRPGYGTPMRSGYAAPARAGFVVPRSSYVSPRGFAAPRASFAAPRGAFGGARGFGGGGAPGGFRGGGAAGHFGGFGGGHFAGGRR